MRQQIVYNTNASVPGCACGAVSVCARPLRSASFQAQGAVMPGLTINDKLDAIQEDIRALALAIRQQTEQFRSRCA